MGYFLTAVSHNKNAIINTKGLKHKEVLRPFSTGRKQITVLEQEETEKVIPFSKFKKSTAKDRSLLLFSVLADMTLVLVTWKHCSQKQASGKLNLSWLLLFQKFETFF